MAKEKLQFLAAGGN